MKIKINYEAILINNQLIKLYILLIRCSVSKLAEIRA